MDPAARVRNEYAPLWWLIAGCVGVAVAASGSIVMVVDMLTRTVHPRLPIAVALLVFVGTPLVLFAGLARLLRHLAADTWWLEADVLRCRLHARARWTWTIQNRDFVVLEPKRFRTIARRRDGTSVSLPRRMLSDESLFSAYPVEFVLDGDRLALQRAS